jgi:hypothetical protein
MFAFALKFPFREEEGWECQCGYDLSYMNPASRKCPECGTTAQLEWSSIPGEFSNKTTRRLYWAIFQFIVSLLVLAIYIIFVMYENSQ